MTQRAGASTAGVATAGACTAGAAETAALAVRGACTGALSLACRIARRSDLLLKSLDLFLSPHDGLTERKFVLRSRFEALGGDSDIFAIVWRYSVGIDMAHAPLNPSNDAPQALCNLCIGRFAHTFSPSISVQSIGAA